MALVFRRPETPPREEAPAPPLWRRAWRPPPPLVEDFTRRGEHFVARLRLVVVALLAAGTAYALGSGTFAEQPAFHVAVVGLLLAEALFLHEAARRGWWSGGLHFLSGGLDGGVVTLVLLGFLLLNPAQGELVGHGIVSAYVLVIASTALRFDLRLCILVVALTLLEYYAVLLVAEPAQRRVLLPEGADAGAERVLVLYNSVFVLAAGVLAWSLVRHTWRLHALSTHDPLTGLLNRSAFEARAEQEIVRSERSGQPFAVAILDIDFFKRVNDRRGHLAGDAVLQGLARLLERSFRRADVVARYGGEEFVVLLLDGPPEEARERADALRRAVAEHAFDAAPDAEPVRITASLGLAGWPRDGRSLRRVLMAADTRLYEAKARGRNRVVAPVPEARETLRVGA